MNLVVDRGNSFTKLALFQGGSLVKMNSCSDDGEIGNTLLLWVNENAITNCIVSNVRDEEFQIPLVEEKNITTLKLSHQTKLPILIQYHTPETLGNDRVANAVAFEIEFPEKNGIVVDCGTCITYTVISNHALVGGAISPGLDMRFRALHHFTGKLPMVQRDENFPVLGRTTEASIRSGVQHGILNEVRGMMAEFSSQFSDLHVIITGGDFQLIEPHLKSRIFARPNFTLYGLNEILERNK